MSTIKQSMVKMDTSCRLCGEEGRGAGDLVEHLREWHRVATRDTATLSDLLNLLSGQNSVNDRKRRKSYSGVLTALRQNREPLNEISNTLYGRHGTQENTLGKENIRRSEIIQPLPRTRKGSLKPDTVKLIPKFRQNEPPGPARGATSSPDILDSPDDSEVTLNLDSPQKQLSDHVEEECSSTDRESVEDGEKMCQEDVKAMIATKRAMVVATTGRYLCPDHSCQFRCEASEILNIHVRNKHRELWGTPVRKQKMAVWLSSENIEASVLNIAKNDLRPLDCLETDECTKERGIDLVEQEISKAEDINKLNDLNCEETSGNEKKQRGKKRKANDNCTSKVNKLLKTDGEKDKIKEDTVKRLRVLQKGKSEGTFVQCSRAECAKWRFLPQFEDPALVPKDWQCSMNQDQRGNSCTKGASEEWVEGSSEMVDTAYAAGSMVWAKIQGFPWWPGLVDFCPDTEEFYWLDAWDDPARETAETGRLTHYHVMLFGAPSVTRSWIKVADLVKMDSPYTPPALSKASNKKHRSWLKATEMASPCFPLGREERLEKFSFAVLFKGKWGNYEAEQKAKKEKKRAKAAEKQLKEESKDKVVKVDVKEEPVRPSEALSLWSPADGWGGAGGQRTVLGRQGDLLLLSWTQGRRVAGYFTDKKEVEGKAEKMADRAVEAGDVCPALEPKAVVGVVVATFHREEGATLEQVCAGVALLFPYYQPRGARCARLVRGVARELGLRPGDRLHLSPALEEEAREALGVEGVQRCLLHPSLLPLLLTPPPPRPSPTFTPAMLATLGLGFTRHSLSEQQLSSLLLLLLPGLHLQPLHAWCHHSSPATTLPRLQGEGRAGGQVTVGSGGGVRRYTLNPSSRQRWLQALAAATTTQANRWFRQPWVADLLQDQGKQ